MGQKVQDSESAVAFEWNEVSQCILNVHVIIFFRGRGQPPDRPLSLTLYTQTEKETRQRNDHGMLCNNQKT